MSRLAGTAKSRIYAGKRGFSKKAIAKIDFFFVLGSYEFLGGAKLEAAIFFAV